MISVSTKDFDGMSEKNFIVAKIFREVAWVRAFFIQLQINFRWVRWPTAIHWKVFDS